MGMHEGHVSDGKDIEVSSSVFHSRPGWVSHEVGMREETIRMVEVASGICIFWAFGGASVQVVGLVRLELARVAGESVCEGLALEGEEGVIVRVEGRSVGQLGVSVRWGRGGKVD